MNAIVLLSGGLDSAVVLAKALSLGRNVTALNFQYGQRHAQELVAARLVANHYRVPLQVVEVPLRLGASLLAPQPAGTQQPNVSPYFVPGRNLALIALADNVASDVGAAELWLGFNADDHAGFPDCRVEFVEMLQCLVDSTLRTPLIDLKKGAVVAEARRLAVPLDLTSSCYEGAACGACDACVLREAALR